MITDGVPPRPVDGVTGSADPTPPVDLELGVYVSEEVLRMAGGGGVLLGDGGLLEELGEAPER